MSTKNFGGKLELIWATTDLVDEKYGHSRKNENLALIIFNSISVGLMKSSNNFAQDNESQRFRRQFKSFL